MSFITWKKGQRFKLSPNFLSTEMECPCSNESCVEQKINSEVVNRIQRVRSRLNQPITPTNAYRCLAYQKELEDRGYQTAKNSQHLLGNAIDVTARDFDKLLELFKEEFRSIGIGRTFLHGDLRDDKERRWFYS